MSILTANTLFHFTGKDDKKGKEALLNILGTGYRPSYCSEFGDAAIGGAIKDMLIPMVCFCDLPLSRLDKHMNGHKWKYNDVNHEVEGYGNYGLGMSKTWGKNMRLNPVTYTYSGSFLLDAAGIAINQLFSLHREFTNKWQEFTTKGPLKYSGTITLKENEKINVDNPPGIDFPSMLPESFVQMDRITNALSNTLAVLAYMKPYQDFTTNQLYYDEREWRHTIPYTKQYKGDVPILTKVDNRYAPLFAGHDQGHDIDHYKQIIEKDYMLKFKPDDIKYIIVKDDYDIIDVMTRLENLVKAEQFTEQDADRLYSRILTSGQIKEDF